MGMGMGMNMGAVTLEHVHANVLHGAEAPDRMTWFQHEHRHGIRASLTFVHGKITVIHTHMHVASAS